MVLLVHKITVKKTSPFSHYICWHISSQLSIYLFKGWFKCKTVTTKTQHSSQMEMDSLENVGFYSCKADVDLAHSPMVQKLKDFLFKKLAFSLHFNLKWNTDQKSYKIS